MRFVYNKSSFDDMYDIIKDNRKSFCDGVVHGFQGNSSQLKDLLELDLYIGICGASLITEEKSYVVKEIPLDRLIVETGSPGNEIS
jgi:Tat protein secretion system quality control protein TatD with DNase activity